MYEIIINVDSLFNTKHLHFLNPLVTYLSSRLHFYKKIANDEIRKISRGLIFAKSPKICKIAKTNPRKVTARKKNNSKKL